MSRLSQISAITYLALVTLCPLQGTDAATPPVLQQATQKQTTSVVQTQSQQSVPVLVVEERGDTTAQNKASTPTTKQVPTLVVEERGKSDAAQQSDAKSTTDDKATDQAATNGTTATDSTEADKQQPVVSTKPVAKAKPKPKRKLIELPPASQQFMRTPQTGDFAAAASPAGYSINLPTAFGEDQLAGYVQGPMLLHATNDNLFAAVSMQDPNNTESYSQASPLPDYADKKVWWRWVLNAPLPANAQVGNTAQKVNAVWNCSLSTYSDFIGDKVILQAETQIAGKTYQQLYVMPAADMYTLLPQALQSLASMKLQ